MNTRMCVVFVLAIAGCRNPLRTESKIHLQDAIRGNINANVSGAVSVRSDPGPLCEFYPDGQIEEAAKIAVLDLDGVLINANTGKIIPGENPIALFQEKLQKAATDPNVAAIVLRINSPGGAVSAVDLLWREVSDCKQRTGKPIVACFLDVGASGAYYIASAADAIVALPNSLTGGVGVITNLYTLEDAMSNFSIFAIPIKAGKYIDMGTPIRPIDKEERFMFQSLAKEYHDRFKSVVQSRRPQLAKADDVLDGRIMSAQKALQAGLIDRVGYIPDAIRLAAELANAHSVQPVMYSRENQPFRSLYATMADRPSNGLLPIDIPGINRRHLPMFLYLWLPEPGLAKGGM